MKELIDIHTHHLSGKPAEAILNCYPDTFVPEEGGLYSVGIHPCQSGEGCFFSDELAQHPQVLAIGEAGLDKLVDEPMSLQAEVFELQARLAMQFGKPLIIHSVKAIDELLQLKKAVRPTNSWIIHGFRGKPALAKEYLRHGFYLSFGEKYQEDALRIVPADRLFLETDESAVSIRSLYERAAVVRQLSLSDLEETIRDNINKVFFKR